MAWYPGKLNILFAGAIFVSIATFAQDMRIRSGALVWVTQRVQANFAYVSDFQITRMDDSGMKIDVIVTGQDRRHGCREMVFRVAGNHVAVQWDSRKVPALNKMIFDVSCGPGNRIEYRDDYDYLVFYVGCRMHQCGSNEGFLVYEGKSSQVSWAELSRASVSGPYAVTFDGENSRRGNDELKYEICYNAGLVDRSNLPFACPAK